MSDHEWPVEEEPPVPTSPSIPETAPAPQPQSVLSVQDMVDEVKKASGPPPKPVGPMAWASYQRDLEKWERQQKEEARAANSKNRLTLRGLNMFATQTGVGSAPAPVAEKEGKAKGGLFSSLRNMLPSPKKAASSSSDMTDQLSQLSRDELPPNYGNKATANPGFGFAKKKGSQRQLSVATMRSRSASTATNATHATQDEPAQLYDDVQQSAHLTFNKFEFFQDVREIRASHPNNLCTKYLKEEYMNSFLPKDQEVLFRCARTGVENPDSGLGCYAMTPKDYATFHGFFDPVIREYHGDTTGKKTHVTDWDISQVGDNGVLDVAKLGLDELSMRVRVGRNLTQFNLPGNMDMAERIEFEKTILGAFAQLQAMPEYGGHIYSLTPDFGNGVVNPNLISQDKYQELVDAHIMFKDMDADPYLKSAGIASDWPYGRGCYVSEDKQFIIWFGEEDQLRIMCMKKGTKLNEVFDRLKAGLDTIESIDGIEFAVSDKYGYVTSCPSNLGTGMRASVHIKVPNLTSDGTDARAKAVCKPLGLSVRGTGGEHTPIGADGTIDLSPSNRLFIKECDIVAKLYEGVRLLMEREQAAAAGVDVAADGFDKSAFLARLAEIKVSHPNNLCAKYLTEELFNSYSTEDQAVLYQCARTGIENPDSGLGCYAMTPKDYATFASFFEPVIREYHGDSTGDKTHVTDWDISQVGDNGVLDVAKLGLDELSMRVRVGRNLTQFNLPGNMDKAERIEFEKTILGAFAQLQAMPEYGGHIYSLTPDFGNGVVNPNLISQDKYQELVDAHIMFKDMDADPYLKSAGIASDWPYGRGCYVSEDKQFIIWFGEEDQLRIMCMKKGTKLNEVFDRLKAGLDTIESIDGIEFAVSDKYGYVTSCPSNLGTGMRASVHIKVPNLTSDGTDARAKAVCKPLGLSVRGTGGEHTPIGADGTIDLSPSNRLFIKECDIVAKLYEGVRLLMEREQAAAAGVDVTADGFDKTAFLARLADIKVTHPNNLCAKYLTADLFNSYSTEDQAVLYQCARTGIENPDSGLGCYAMTPKDYATFASFFEPVIREYHGDTTGDKTHVTDWDISQVGDNGVLDVAKLGLDELSMRVRVGRNLTQFNLPGNMDKAERIEFEKTILGAFAQLQAMPEYGGHIYSLTPDFGNGVVNPNLISQDKYQELVDAHIMFKDMDADPYLKSAGIASDWPYGRGCYVSEDKQFIIWFGEEDQLRIMCMKKGTKLNEVFDRLKAGLDTIESIDGIEFAVSDKYGYVTSCPSNLGTGMRASVHIKVPNLTSDGTDARAKAVCKPLGLSVRGTGGEHTPIGADGTIDLSPSNRLFIKECDIVAKLYEGVRLLMEREQAAAAGVDVTADGFDKSAFLAQLAEIKVSHPNNLCAKYLTEELFNSYSTEDQAVLYQCARTGIENPDSGLGCYAMTPKDYATFASFFEPVIREYHGDSTGNKTHVTDWDISQVGDNGVLDVAKLGLDELSMRVRVGRNLTQFNLPGNMDKAERIEFEKTILGAFAQLQAMPEYGGHIYSLTPDFGNGVVNPNLISQDKYQELVDAHIMFKDMDADPYLKSAGIASDWPYGRGCYVSEDKQFIIWFGEEDQLRIMCMKKGTKLNEVFDRLKAGLDTIESIDGIEFAVSDKYGYVTSCPSNLGTGMRASVHIKVPNLTSDGTDARAKAVCKPLGLSVRGTGGEHTPIGADGTIDLSPSNRLFIKECDIVAKLYEGVRLLMEEEQTAGAA